MAPRDHYLNHTRGFASWAFTLDHKRIGVMYLVATLASFLLGGCAALAVRTELISRGPTIMERRHLQQDVHAPRRGDGLPVHHSRASPRRSGTSSFP